jgi:sialidase-1
MEHRVIYKKEGVYACFPSLMKLADGRLVATYSTRTHASHVDATGGSMTVVSEDGGQTWTTTDQDYHNPEWASSDGTLANARAYAWRYAPAAERERIEQRGIEVRPTPGGDIAYAFGVTAEISTDGGASWHQRPVDFPHRPLTMGFHENATYLRLNDATVMRLVYSRTRVGRRYYEVWALRSDDNGESWRGVPVAADADEETGYGESAILRCGNGDLLVAMRTENTGGTSDLMSMTRSADGGLTWSQPQPTNMAGHPPDLLMLANGHILCTFGYRKDPMGIRAMISTDDGYSFPDETLVMLRDDGPKAAEGGRGGDLGYPVSVQLSDDTLFTIYYMTCADGVTHIAGTHWREDA